MKVHLETQRVILNAIHHICKNYIFFPHLLHKVWANTSTGPGCTLTAHSPMALYRGSPVSLSHTKVVSLWLVTPTAERERRRTGSVREEPSSSLLPSSGVNGQTVWRRAPLMLATLTLSWRSFSHVLSMHSYTDWMISLGSSSTHLMETKWCQWALMRRKVRIEVGRGASLVQLK